jgi:hypothetical protein
VFDPMPCHDACCFAGSLGHGGLLLIFNVMNVTTSNSMHILVYASVTSVSLKVGLAVEFCVSELFPFEEKD